MRIAHVFCLIAAALLAQPAAAATLTRIGAGGFSITDGTSNTVAFGEGTRASVCLQGGGGSITDGTSNTIFFGERGGFTLLDATLTGFGAADQIQDGTSNTIFIGETLSLCLRDAVIGPPATSITDGTSNTIRIGEGGSIDLCLSGLAGVIRDGSSNTIAFGEQFCAFGLRLDPDAVIEAAGAVSAAVPAPPALALCLTGIAALLLRRRRRGAPTLPARAGSC